MQKGQIFSLDFLISIVAVMAAIGLMIQAIELNTYYQKEGREFNELKAVAETAGNMLVSNFDMVCDLTTNSGDVITPLNNCLSMTDPLGISPACRVRPGGHGGQPPPGCKVKGDVKIISKPDLGIPEDFDCYISTTGGGMSGNEQLIIWDCLDEPPADVENFYSITREVVIYKGSTGNGDDSGVEKSEFEDCLQGADSCKLNLATVTIQVWKA